MMGGRNEGRVLLKVKGLLTDSLHDIGRVMNNKEIVPSQRSSEFSGERVIEQLITMQCNTSI